MNKTVKMGLQALLACGVSILVVYVIKHMA